MVLDYCYRLRTVHSNAYSCDCFERSCREAKLSEFRASRHFRNHNIEALIITSIIVGVRYSCRYSRNIPSKPILIIKALKPYSNYLGLYLTWFKFEGRFSVR